MSAIMNVRRPRAALSGALWSVLLGGGALGACALAGCANEAEAPDIGVHQAAIVGGELAEPVPWAVQVNDVRGDTGDFFQCTATLVAPRWVLTAQHCLADENETTAIRIGSNEYRQGRVIAVDHVEVNHWEIDAALLHLTEVAGTEFVPLPNTEPSTGNTPATLYGWGSEGTPLVMAPFLKKAQIAITDRVPPGDLLVTSGVTGAGWSGDSGGPVMVDGRQAGILVQSLNQNGTRPQGRNRIVNLHRLLPWLRQIVAQDEITPPPSDRVVVYDLSSFDGIQQTFGVGRYRLGDMQRIGNDRAGALRIPANLKVTAYEHDNFEGISHEYTEDTDLVAAGFADAISSLVVEAR